MAKVIIEISDVNGSVDVVGKTEPANLTLEEANKSVAIAVANSVRLHLTEILNFRQVESEDFNG